MRIVLDLQACQTENRFRDTGRYSMSLAKAMAKNANGHEIWLFLNDLFPETIPYIRQSFEGLIPKERIYVFSVPGPVFEMNPQNEWRTRAAELIREYALTRLKPDIVHNSSLFEGYGDNAVTSIGMFYPKILTSITLYDLMPYIDSENCLFDEQMKKWYYRKIQSLKNAGLYLAISEYSKKEAIDNLGFAQENIVNISADADDKFEFGHAKFSWDESAKRAIGAFEALNQKQNSNKLISSDSKLPYKPYNFNSAVEQFSLNSEQSEYKNLINLLSNIDVTTKPTQTDLIQTSEAIANNFFLASQEQFFIDISSLVQIDLKTGIQRVTRAITLELLKNPPCGFRVEPVYFDGQHYRYARRFTSKFLNIDQCKIDDEIIDIGRNDIFLGLDLNAENLVPKKKILGLYNTYGIRIYFIVYDLLPVRHPEWFMPGDKKGFESWLKMIYEVSSGLICISKFTADDLISWFKENNYHRIESLNLAYSHQGADLNNSVPTAEMPEDAEYVLKNINSSPSFLMVGTIEPRKGHLQAIEAFSLLWQEDINVNLVIVGKEAWKDISVNLKRTVPLILSKLIEHHELYKHLFWLEGISDEYLEKVYAACACLVAASEGEGFGLPLIEAAHHKLPIIARDIPVFREVAGDYAFYFKGNKPEDLAMSIKTWLRLYKEGKHPKSDNLPWLTWKQSAEQLKEIIFNNKWGYNPALYGLI